jgi:hypothetical protein
MLAGLKRQLNSSGVASYKIIRTPNNIVYISIKDPDTNQEVYKLKLSIDDKNTGHFRQIRAKNERRRSIRDLISGIHNGDVNKDIFHDTDVNKYMAAFKR